MGSTYFHVKVNPSYQIQASNHVIDGFSLHSGLWQQKACQGMWHVACLIIMHNLSVTQLQKLICFHVL